MNILFITHHDNFQGSSRSLMSLIEGLLGLGITPFVVNPAKSAFTEALEDHGVQFVVLPIPWWVAEKSFTLKEKLKHAREIRSSVERIKALIQEWHIDLVYTNTSVIPVGFLAARYTHLPHIWHIREYFYLYFGWKYIFPAWLSKFIFSRSDAIICHARGVQQYYFPSSPANVHHVYNGVATIPEMEKRLQARLSKPEKHTFTFAMLSNINPKKGQEQAIQALARLREDASDARLFIVGNGKPDYVNYLQQLVTDLDLTDCVTFTGLADDPFPYFFSADCTLICSEFEALSRVGLEAMSAALPVIGKNSGGNPEIIEHGTTGFLYDSFEELVTYMKRMVQKPEEARQMGLAGWQRARDLFNIEDYAVNVYRVIQSVMEKR